MKRFALVTVFSSPHILPFISEMSNYYDEVFVVELSPITIERKQMGYEVSKENVKVLKYYQEQENAQYVIDSADDIIFADKNFNLLQNRLKNNKKCWIVSERIFKKGIIKWCDPRTWKLMRFCRTVRRLPVYLLAIGKYAANDFIKLGFNRNKIYSFGYFPELNENSNISVSDTSGKKVILWVGRFVDWKKPFRAIKVIKTMPDNYVLHMIGDGKLLSKAKRLSASLNERVVFYGNLPNCDVIRHMHNCDVFLSLSGREEGWGVVVNEAMYSGCAIVCNDKMGCVGMLANNDNCVIFHGNDIKKIRQAVYYAVLQKEQLGEVAKKTIKDEFNYKIAAERFAALSAEADGDIYSSGLLSRVFK